MQQTVLQSFLLWGLAAIVIIATPLILWLVPPPFFSSATIDITRGTTISDTAVKLADAGVVYTPEVVKIPFLLSDKQLVAGTYKFSDAQAATTVVDRLTTGDFRTPQTQVVIPEGFTNEQIADRLSEVLADDSFSRSDFITQAEQYQGYLYPDTYRLHNDTSADEVIRMMRDNFEEKIEPLQEEITGFEYDLPEIVKMASLVELEAADYEIRRRIAGVLWKRLAEGMPLQVDAVFVPLLGKNTYELTREDLQTKSPYNLYINTGLPPRPIANPSIESIRATINPIVSDDLYYLSDRDKNFYFAETLFEHNQNKRDYMQTDAN